MAAENKKKILKRKYISIENKIDILNRLEEGQRIAYIARSLCLNEATVATIKRNGNKIRNQVIEGISVSAKRVARTRDIDMIRMEKSLFIWIDDCVNKKIPLSGRIIQQKALKIYNHLKKTSSNSTAGKTHSFSASKGWFEKVKKRFNLHNVKLSGESASADAEEARKYPVKLKEIIENGEYTAEQIFNADETGLYWKKLPTRTYITMKQKSVPGLKMAKDRITLQQCIG